MLSLYVHIPFCRTRCVYCDFYLVTRQDLLEPFFQALLVETEARLSRFKGRSVKAIHFGGGTPSLFPVSYLSRWLELVHACCTFTPDVEITLEANPEDLGGGRMFELHAAGINRLSIGVQSFNQRKLAALGRSHTREQGLQAARTAGDLFQSVSVDLICAVPDETRDEWASDLRDTVTLQLPHVSVYMLSVEPKTRLHRSVSRGDVTVPGEDVQATLYEDALGTLAGSGYQHYEVSNFSVDGHHSRYNLACWMREPYLGFGPSAHSFIVDGGAEIRQANVSLLSRYMADPQNAATFYEVLSENERFLEQVFLTLRINRGLDIGFLRKGNKLGHCIADKIEELRASGLVFEEGGKLFLTSKGFLFADHIAGELVSD
ncbi:MAG: radical SAM family heme chaperone HemW [Chlorobiaceae bacterium]|jgi:oxygen-independent coproporphyrinogen III oxidase|nr:radical SAM family heme chaperone HemW [Chlorobiaceae bacterium]NTW63047.1 radical SAM family heme chaperone HemW [Chlorobiaceae bacterium]